jgi:hypothetical protein
MAFVFEDEEQPSGGFVFEDEAPQPVSVRMADSDPKQLPKTWDVEVGGQRLRGTFDPKAGTKGAYVLPAADGGTLYIVKGQDGSLGLKRLRGKPAPKVAQPVLGLAQGVSDVANWGAGVIESGARLIDKGFQAVGIDPYTSLDEGELPLGIQRSTQPAIENQRAAYDEATQGSGLATAGRVAGQIAATLPVAEVRAAEALAGGLSKISPAAAQQATKGWRGRAIDGAAQGATGAAVTSTANPDIGTGEQTSMGAGVGALTSATLPPALRSLAQGVSSVINSVTRRMAPEEAQTLGATLQVSLKQAGIDPGNMSREVQQRLVEYLESGATDLSPQAIQRIANAESLAIPVKLTKGAVTRDFQQQQAESMLSRMPAGQALREQEIANNSAITKNLEKAAADQKPTAATPYQVGNSVRGALQGAEDASWRQVGQAYNKARATGKEVMIDPAPIVEQINKNIDAINANNDAGPIMQMVSSLERFKVIKKNNDGLYEPTGNQMMGDQLMQLYQAANQSFKPGTTSAIHIGDVKRGILAALDTVGDTGPEYRTAINSMKRHVREFDDPKAVSQILKMSSDSDPMIAAEKIFDRAFVKASIDDVDRLTRMMLRSDKSVRRDATTAVRNMRAGLVRHLLDESFVGQATNEAGERVISGNNMVRAIEKLGGGDLATGWQKVDALMGKKHTAELKKIVGAAYDATSKVPAAAQTSGTAERILSALGRLPLLGGPSEMAVRGTIDGIKSQMQKKAARSATNSIELLGEPAAARKEAEKAAIGRRIASPAATLFPALYQAATE